MGKKKKENVSEISKTLSFITSLKKKKKGGNIALAQLKHREKTSHYYIHVFVALNQAKLHTDRE